MKEAKAERSAAVGAAYMPYASSASTATAAASAKAVVEDALSAEMEAQAEGGAAACGSASRGDALEERVVVGAVSAVPKRANMEGPYSHLFAARRARATAKSRGRAAVGALRSADSAPVEAPEEFALRGSSSVSPHSPPMPATSGVDGEQDKGGAQHQVCYRS